MGSFWSNFYQCLMCALECTITSVKAEGKEEDKAEEKKELDPILGIETSPKDTKMSLEIIDQEVDATLTTLNTPVKKKKEEADTSVFQD